MKKRYALYIGFVALVFSGTVFAQETAEVGADEETEASVADRFKALEEKLESQQQQLDAQKEQIETESENVEKLNEELALAQEERDSLNQQVMANEQGSQRKYLSVFGFFDLTYLKYLPDAGDKAAIFVDNYPKANTFVVENLNIYFKSEMTDTLEFLAEIRFSFHPQGYVEEFPVQTYVNGEFRTEDGEYVRVDNGYKSSYSVATFTYGSILIERVHLDYKPFDFFSIRLGRFLTPYGIFNVDHGSPVTVTVNNPSIINNEYIPNNQTGIELFGRVFPSDSTQLDYAVTLSNGRGPMAEVYDLDENKAVGLRLKVTWFGENASVAAGGYTYYGQYTDNQQYAKTYLQTNPGTSRLTFDENEEYPLQSSEVIVEKYREVAVSADLKVEFFGVSIFGEYVWRRVYYDNLPQADPFTELATGTTPGVTTYAADFIGQGAYGLLAYTLPLDKWLGGVKIVPWGGVDYVAPVDYLDFNRYMFYRFGVNVRPSPYVVVKTEFSRFDAQSKLTGGDSWLLSGQVAVTF